MEDLLAQLNEPQRQAVMHVDGPLLVLAGAGSGKTRVITTRVAYLVAQGIEPWNILALTFTNKAAGEMAERVSDLRVPPGATICTFHSLCARLLREFASEAGLDARYSIYDRQDQLKVAKAALESIELKGSFTPAKLHAAVSNAKNDLRTAEAFAEQASDFRDRAVAEFYLAYERMLRENNAVDFDDLLMRVAILLRDRPDLRTHLGQRFRYVLIDEYQDTNHAQYVIAHAIALDHENVCATGDPDQSIYAWRGADIHNILDFEKDYPNATVIRLEENYRSRQPILSAASRLIDHNTMRKPKELFTRKEGGEDVRIVTVDDEHAEARLLADRVDAYRNAGGNYGDVAVFYRVNSLSRVLEEALLRKGVPYRIARGTEFYNRKEIKDVLAYCKLLVNEADDLSCERIINTPTRGIGAATLKKLRQYAAIHSMSLIDACRAAEGTSLSTRPQKKVLAFADMVDHLGRDLRRPVRYVLEDVFRHSGLEEALSRSDEDSKQARANIEELISSAAEFDEEDHGEQPLGEFLQHVSLVSDVDRFEGASGAVNLMTLHAAKGLEFPVVFMVGCEEGMLPFEREPAIAALTEDIAKTEEERRLAFVGMTRAKEQLTMVSARSRMHRGRRTPQALSRFCQEIGDEAITREDKTTSAGEASRPGRRHRGGFYAASREREIIEQVADRAIAPEPLPEDRYESTDDEPPPFPPEYETLRPGRMVYHKKFGTGKVVKLAQPWPNTRATILFQDFGEKKLVLAMTNLDMVD